MLWSACAVMPLRCESERSEDACALFSRKISRGSARNGVDAARRFVPLTALERSEGETFVLLTVVPRFAGLDESLGSRTPVGPASEAACSLGVVHFEYVARRQAALLWTFG